MRGNPKRALVAAIGVIGGLTATLALAGEWERAIINKIVIHADKTVSVFRNSEKEVTRVDWPNPDACDNSSRAILRPYQEWHGVASGILSYEQAYAALLGAKLNGQTITVLLDGCTMVDGLTFPMIQAVAVID